MHTSSYLDELETFCREGGGYLDADTYAAPASWAIAHEAAGGGLSVVQGHCSVASEASGS